MFWSGNAELGIINDELEIFPNPTSNQLTINSEKLMIKEIKIYNVLGCEILKQVQNDKNTTIDIANLSKGIYFIEAQTEKGIIRRKFVKG